MIKKAKIISVDTDPVSYHYNSEPRGSKDYVLSRSDLMEFYHCPQRWIKGYREKETNAKKYGSIIDCYILDRYRFSDKYAAAPKGYFNEKEGKDKPWNWNATICKEWRDIQQGKIIIKIEDLVACEKALDSICKDEIINNLINHSDKQVMITAVWQSDNLQIPLKTLIDLVPRRQSNFNQYLCDFKTCKNASPSQWSREVYRYGYHVQAAFYIDMYYAATGEARDGFVHILQESFAPYEVGRRLLSEEFIELGRQIYQEALKKYCECWRKNIWPGYDDDSRNNIDGFTICEPESWMIGGKEL